LVKDVLDVGVVMGGLVVMPSSYLTRNGRFVMKTIWLPFSQNSTAYMLRNLSRK
jgi:hypothetical protein